MSAPSPAPVSRLHPLAPIGIGTGAVESLTGYIARLAVHHALPAGRLITGELLPAAAGLTPAAIRQPFANLDWGTLDGTGTRSAAWLRCVAALTSREDLGHLTVLSWLRAISKRYLLRTEAAYCGTCFSDDLAVGEPYERLAWRLTDVNACSVHGTLLSTACRWCGRLREPLAWWAIPGYCPHCLRWLGAPSRNSADGADGAIGAVDAATDVADPATPVQLLIASTLMAGLAERSKGEPTPGGLRASLATIIETRYGGNQAALARDASFRSKSVVTSWLQGSTPTLRSVLRVALATGANLASVLAGEPSFPNAVAPEVAAALRSEQHRELDWGAIKRRLAAEIAAAEPVTLASVARDFGIYASSIRKSHPDLAHDLADRTRDATRQRGLARPGLVEEVVADVVAGIISEGGDPTRREVERRLPEHLSIREAAVGEAWRRARGDELDQARS